MVNVMSVVGGFIADGQSSCKPSYYESSAELTFETLLDARIISVIVSGVSSAPLLENVI